MTYIIQRLWVIFVSKLCYINPFLIVRMSKHVYNADLTCRTSITRVLVETENVERSDKIITEQSICNVSYAVWCGFWICATTKCLAWLFLWLKLVRTITFTFHNFCFCIDTYENAYTYLSLWNYFFMSIIYLFSLVSWFIFGTQRVFQEWMSSLLRLKGYVNWIEVFYYWISLMMCFCWNWNCTSCFCPTCFSTHYTHVNQCCLVTETFQF